MTSSVRPVADAATLAPDTAGTMAASSVPSAARPYAALCEPLQIGDLTLRNRNIMASLSRNRSGPNTIPNDVNLLYYTQRAQGGCGLILSEGTLVSQQGSEWPYTPGIWSDAHVEGWKRVTSSVHAAGSLIFCQLWHVGRAAHPDMPEQKASGKPVVAPSAIAAHGGKFRDLPGKPGYVQPTTLEDPRTIIEEFRNAAIKAKEAGFDGVELHSANGYLVHQFLDTGSNHRTDEWGGSIENRCRLGLEILKVLVEIWGPSRVGIKVSPCGGYNDVGMPLPETISTFVHYITQICALGVAYVQLVRYIPFMDQPLQPEQLHEGEPEGQYKRGIPHDALAVYGPLVKLSRAIMADHREQQMRGLALPPKAAGSVRTRLLLNGALPPREADALIADGLIDGAVFGQLWIGNPDLQRRIEAGLDVDGKGINECTNMKAFHYTTNGNPHQGYTDYPTYPRDHSHPEKPKRTVSASAELDAAAIARKRTKSDAHAMS